MVACFVGGYGGGFRAWYCFAAVFAGFLKACGSLVAILPRVSLVVTLSTFTDTVTSPTRVLTSALEQTQVLPLA